MTITDFPEYRQAHLVIAERDIAVTITTYVPEQDGPLCDAPAKGVILKALGGDIQAAVEALARRIEAESFGVASIRICDIACPANAAPGLRLDSPVDEESHCHSLRKDARLVSPQTRRNGGITGHRRSGSGNGQRRGMAPRERSRS